MAIENKVQLWGFRLGWLMIVFWSIVVFLNVLDYFSFRTDVEFLLWKGNLVQNLTWMASFYVHITSSIICLVTGPFQFVPRLRHRYPKLHRKVGKAYVFTILFLAAPSGLYMAFFANGGFWAQLAFFILAWLWFITTFLALQTAIKRDFVAHRKWMVRSYALVFSAVTLRLYMPLLTYGIGQFGLPTMDPELAVVVTSWINWVPNLLIAELLLRLAPKSL
ncbi:DUF2306 domain-containing protein [Microscilla marina]|uniref:Membrane protein, putative n=1 Tax=Microscilla marina ATCC 23134 TaxID=313606 RepID=A1ZIZ4_MICM2|nr:DUF2306 domain-containing protein [Microscilla marina]EAY29530.1 membrane protein, putative [Microscilla marina ATCC 23134]